MKLPSTMGWNGHEMPPNLWSNLWPCGASLVAQLVKNQPAKRETWVWSLGWEDPLEESMATHSVVLPRESPWTEEPGMLQSMGWQRVRYNWATKHTCMGLYQLQIGSCHSACHIPLPGINTGAAAGDFQPPLKGAEGLEQKWSTLGSGKSWQDRSSNRYPQEAMLWAQFIEIEWNMMVGKDLGKGRMGVNV